MQRSLQKYKYRFPVHQPGDGSLITERQITLPRRVIAYPSAYYLRKKGLSGGFTLEEITRNSGDAKQVVENQSDIFFIDYRSKTCSENPEMILVHILL